MFLSEYILDGGPVPGHGLKAPFSRVHEYRIVFTQIQRGGAVQVTAFLPPRNYLSYRIYLLYMKFSIIDGITGMFLLGRQNSPGLDFSCGKGGEAKGVVRPEVIGFQPSVVG